MLLNIDRLEMPRRDKRTILLLPPNRPQIAASASDAKSTPCDISWRSQGGRHTYRQKSNSNFAMAIVTFRSCAPPHLCRCLRRDEQQTKETTVSTPPGGTSSPPPSLFRPISGYGTLYGLLIPVTLIEGVTVRP